MVEELVIKWIPEISDGIPENTAESLSSDISLKYILKH